MRHQNRDRHQSHHRVRDAAKQNLTPAGVTVGAHHKQVAAFVFHSRQQGGFNGNRRRRTQSRHFNFNAVTGQHESNVGAGDAVAFLVFECERDE